MFGSCEKLQTDEHFKDYLYFYEYFHGDNGRGLGATHQTGWTSLIAMLLENRAARMRGTKPHTLVSAPQV